ncbi:unnamed protein product [Notodromas monacha]|uniref:Uncharacterized protein n=1 Tax=Notodromas monacha TaxID=399045 RepID=A0A7R9BEN1_9CRUS|nr:unnamed protein product [Notodromas monacha]CAG0913890.1 unnamed protein product [Notodromas monacha]
MALWSVLVSDAQQEPVILGSRPSISKQVDVSRQGTGQLKPPYTILYQDGLKVTVLDAPGLHNKDPISDSHSISSPAFNNIPAWQQDQYFPFGTSITNPFAQSLPYWHLQQQQQQRLYNPNNPLLNPGFGNLAQHQQPLMMTFPNGLMGGFEQQHGPLMVPATANNYPLNPYSQFLQNPFGVAPGQAALLGSNVGAGSSGGFLADVQDLGEHLTIVPSSSGVGLKELQTQNNYKKQPHLRLNPWSPLGYDSNFGGHQQPYDGLRNNYNPYGMNGNIPGTQLNANVNPLLVQQKLLYMAG